MYRERIEREAFRDELTSGIASIFIHLFPLRNGSVEQMRRTDLEPVHVFDEAVVYQHRDPKNSNRLYLRAYPIFVKYVLDWYFEVYHDCPEYPFSLGTSNTQGTSEALRNAFIKEYNLRAEAKSLLKSSMADKSAIISDTMIYQCINRVFYAQSNKMRSFYDSCVSFGKSQTQASAHHQREHTDAVLQRNYMVQQGNIAALCELRDYLGAWEYFLKKNNVDRIWWDGLIRPARVWLDEFLHN